MRIEHIEDVLPHIEGRPEAISLIWVIAQIGPLIELVSR